MRNTKIQWYRIPVGLGIGFLGLVQFYKVSSREKERRETEDGEESTKAPKRRPRVRPDGPWYANSHHRPYPTSMPSMPPMLIKLQASPGHVDSTSQGHLQALGQVQ